jgi:hypothetical protein
MKSHYILQPLVLVASSRFRDCPLYLSGDGRSGSDPGHCAGRGLLCFGLISGSAPVLSLAALRLGVAGM